MYYGPIKRILGPDSETLYQLFCFIYTRFCYFYMEDR